MKCPAKKMRDLAVAHELHKFYENHHPSHKLVEEQKSKKKSKNLFVWLVVSGVLAAGAAIAYYILRSKEDFYGDDLWYDEDEDTLFDDEDEYDLELEEALEEALEEEFEAELEEALLEEIAKELNK